MAKGDRIVPGYLRDRILLCATACFLILVLTSLALFLNRSTAVALNESDWRTVIDAQGVSRLQHVRRPEDIALAEDMILATGGALFLVAGFALLHAILRVTTQPRRGHCRQCGYDLTGNVSGRCPECGTLIRGRVWFTRLD